MTPQLTAAIAAIQPLSPPERQQLLQILIQSDAANSQTDLKNLSNHFVQGISLTQLLAVKTPPTVDNLKNISANCWPPEDSIEDFLAFLQQQRQTVS
ncbi:MAG: hypothetical protein HC916_09995 [Coleofasciculaceae cyanobacterium SM2_1_6]|nr:hypothetical protein [Coleofasciculaceae cyanobacterium SM2_1_6]